MAPRGAAAYTLAMMSQGCRVGEIRPAGTDDYEVRTPAATGTCARTDLAAIVGALSETLGAPGEAEFDGVDHLWDQLLDEWANDLAATVDRSEVATALQRLSGRIEHTVPIAFAFVLANASAVQGASEFLRARRSADFRDVSARFDADIRPSGAAQLEAARRTVSRHRLKVRRLDQDTRRYRHD